MTVYTGTNNADTIYGGSGSDTIYGLGGNDTLAGQDGADTIYGGDGNDVIYNTSSLYDNYADYLYGENGDDKIFIGTGDHASGGAGFDTLYAYFQNVVSGMTLDFTSIWTGGTFSLGTAAVTGMESLYVCYGGNGNDTITSGSIAGSSPQIFGWYGSDTLYGGAGNDWLEGFSDGGNPDAVADTLYGGGGDDLLGGGVNDYIDGGSGNDTLKLDLTGATSGATADFTLLLAGYTGSIFGATLISIEHISQVIGTNYDDTFDLSANTINSNLYGNAGNDTLISGSGADLVSGNAGNDVVIGGGGRDTLYGGADADTFVFRPGDMAGLTATTADLIGDFNHAQGDKIDLTGLDAIAGGSDDAFAFLGTGAFTGVAGQLRYDYAGGYTTVYGDTDGDGIADIAVALTGNITLVSGDFVL